MPHRIYNPYWIRNSSDRDRKLPGKRSRLLYYNHHELKRRHFLSTVPMDTGSNVSNNNNNPPMPGEGELLAKLHEANRLLEADEKSLQSLAPASSASGSLCSHKSHSRQYSSSSVGSSTSSSSHFSSFANDDDEATTNESLWEIWGRIVHDWDSVRKKTMYLRDLTRHGIPHHFRSLAWQLLTNAHDSPTRGTYAEYLRKTSPSEKQIRRDIARTFPDHDFFKDKDGLGQESLFNVMKAYSLEDREVGYCQGSGFIVGLLLMQMPEEEAFAVFVRLMQEYRLRELFKPSMAELGLCMYQLENMLQDLLPEIHMHFNSQAFHTSMYASTWFLTLYVTCLPLSAALRIMDLFVLEGMEIIFRIGIAILESHKDELLSMDMEGMINFFQKKLPSLYQLDSEADALIHDAYQVRYNAKKMKKLEKDYTALKSKEQEEQIELRRLRTENRLLRQRIDNLEKESSDLADKLIHYQVIRAQEAEETFVLKNDLSSSRQKIGNLTEQLTSAQQSIETLEHEKSSPSSATFEMMPRVIELREQLTTMREKDRETTAIIEELQMKVAALDDANKELQRAPSNDIQQLQEELIAAKLREAESNLALKELRQRVHELDLFWQKHFEANKANKSTGTSLLGKDKNIKQELRLSEEELMTVRLREAATLSELKDSKLRIMELETQNQISTNQIRRMCENNETCQRALEQSEERVRELTAKMKEFDRRMADMETSKQEMSMMQRIKEMEDAQLIEGLRQKIFQLEIERDELAMYKKEENMTEKVENRIDDDDDDTSVVTPQLETSTGQPLLTDTMANSMTISMTNSMMMSMDEDDLAEAIASTDTLNRTLSDIIEGRSPPATPSSSADRRRASHGESSSNPSPRSPRASDETDANRGTRAIKNLADSQDFRDRATNYDDFAPSNDRSNSGDLSRLVSDIDKYVNSCDPSVRSSTAILSNRDSSRVPNNNDFRPISNEIT